jgi:monovalent cation/hydrogen antiporter
VHLELSDIATVFALLVVSVLVAGLAERTRISAPIVLVVVGLAVSQVPGVPDYQLNPEVVLFFFLPPLLYYAAWSSSVRSFRNDVRAITLLSVGLVLATTAAVGFAAWALIPGLPPGCRFRPRRDRRATRRRRGHRCWSPAGPSPTAHDDPVRGDCSTTPPR